MIHVYPLDDDRPHVLTWTGCACNPQVKGEVVVHNSFDGRELLERAEAAWEKLIAPHFT